MHNRLPQLGRASLALILIGAMWGIAGLMLMGQPATPSDVPTDTFINGSFAVSPDAPLDSPASPAEVAALDTAFAQAAAAYSALPNVNFTLQIAGRTVDYKAGAGVLYVRTLDEATGAPMPGRVLVVPVILENGTWTIRLPGDPAYSAAFDRFPPGLVNRIDPSPYEAVASADSYGPLSLTDYRLPWQHNTGGMVTRSYNYHGTGQIDFVIDNTNIVAAKSGTIIYINDTNTQNTYASGAWWYWNTVVIQHGPNEFSTYGHLAYNSVPQWIKNGCTTNYATTNCSVPVQAGQIIGIQGNTGWSTGPHLHINFGQQFMVDTRFAVPTGYAYTLQNVAFAGYTVSEVFNWPVGQRLIATHENQPSNPVVRANTNLIRNGDFTSGTTSWQTSGSITAAVSSGVYGFRRTAEASAAVVYQDAAYSASVNLPFEINLQLANAGSDSKRVSVQLSSSINNQGAITCSFTIPGSAPLQSYIVRGKNSAAWANVRFSLTLETVGGGNLQLDNVSARYRTDINPTATECLTVPTPLAPDGTASQPYGNPSYSWTTVPGATTYELLVYRSDVPSTPYFYLPNLAASTYCSGNTCTVEPTNQPSLNEAARLTDGWHVVYVRANTMDVWGGPRVFLFDAPSPLPPGVSTPSGTNTLRPSFTITLSGAAEYSNKLRVFLIHKTRFDAGNYTALIDQWYTRADFCGSATATTCRWQTPFDLQDDTDYYLFLQGYGAGGFSAGGPFSNGWSGVQFRVDTVPDAAVPANVRATGNQGNPSIQWNDDTRSDSFYVYLRRQSDGGTAYLQWHQKAGTSLCNGTTCGLTLPLALSNGTYEVYVYACGAGGCSSGGPYGNGWGGGSTNGTFTLSFGTPALVSGLNASVVGGTVNASWTAPAGVSRYSVWVGTANATRTYYLQWHSALDLNCAAPAQTCQISLPLGLGSGTIYVAVQSGGPGGLSVGGLVNNGYQVSGAVVIP
ncbi:MAG: peptidoglycan DD-metalloendopeptidase family protein [bacterium]|nr:peptidoglycan DD-metalloendopeptidase family protein [bacterium]